MGRHISRLIGSFSDEILCQKGRETARSEVGRRGDTTTECRGANIGVPKYLASPLALEVDRKRDTWSSGGRSRHSRIWSRAVSKRTADGRSMSRCRREKSNRQLHFRIRAMEGVPYVNAA